MRVPPHTDVDTLLIYTCTLLIIEGIQVFIAKLFFLFSNFKIIALVVLNSVKIKAPVS